MKTIGTSSVSGGLPTDGNKPLYDNNTSTPSIDHDTSAVVSKPECFDVVELINDLGKDSKSKSPDKSEPAQQQQSEMNEAKNQHENELLEGNSDRSDLKATDNIVTKEKISLEVQNILSVVERLFANNF